MGTQSWKKGRGPLVPFADGFRVRLLGMGHSQGSVKRYLVLMGQLNRWLAAAGLGVEELTWEVAQRFLDHRRAAGQRRVPTLASLTPPVRLPAGVECSCRRKRQLNRRRVMSCSRAIATTSSTTVA